MEYFDKTRPIYIQIFEKYRQDIVAGYLQPGMKLRSVRELAEEMVVNPNTMQRAMAELEREQLVYTKRNAGKYVTENTNRIKEVRDELAKNNSIEYVKFMKNLGYSKHGALQYLDNLEF